MFNSQIAYGRAVGRIVFGVVLILGTAMFVERVLRVPQSHAARTLAIVWLAAFFAGWLFAQLAAITARRQDVTEIFTLSWVLPVFGAALLLPLTLHVPVSLALGVEPRGFDSWARISLFVTAPAHLVFALLATVRAARIAQDRPAMSATRVYVITLVASAIPYAVLFFIPPILVGLTGFALLPLVARMKEMIERERGTTALPRAIVVA